MDHEIVTSKLRAYVLGTVDPAEAAGLRSHLETCEACAQEERAVRALVAPLEELSEIERRRLRRGVMTALGDEAAEPSVEVTSVGRGRSLWSRLVPALGAAAAVLLVATGVYLGAQNLGGSDAEFATGAPTDSADEESAPEAETLHESGAGGADQDFGTTANYVGNIARTSSGALTRLGKNAFTGAEVQRSAGALDASAETETATGDAGGHAPSQKDSGANSGQASFLAAPPPLLDECIASLMELQPDWVPTYSATAIYRDQPALIAGFLYPGGGTGALDHFAVYVWAEDDCATILDALSGTLSK